MGWEEALRRIDRVLERNGLSRAEFVRLGSNDGLADPELRDLWLIWGRDVSEELQATSAA
ncbi:MAG: hypothetical protein ACK5RL_06165 [Acidimicrobiales bacterium]